ncbi:MAG: GNAT family N-acetyltransferase [Roseburia sp.]|nr:GNAT family N-acetyltransferase [Roseburia sp.]MCM1279746.1 GNAT family N-acetyltransferase [Robinsoniella sp.]
MKETMVIKTNHLTEDEKKIREEVFMMEQGFQSEFDDIDSIATHLVFYEAEQPIAACRYYQGEEEGLFWLGRIAVQKTFRGKHIGKQIVLAAEKEIRKEGGKQVQLSAQVRAKEFYEKCGYRAVGEIYLDEDCPHVCMNKALEN